MQAVTALAHLQACVLYFFDLSETCGWTLEEQGALFDNISPLFQGKPLIIVANKTDLQSWDSLDKRKRAILEKCNASVPNCLIMPMSSHAEDGVAAVKKKACEVLLETRVGRKTRGTKINNVMNRLHVAQPAKRDSKTRKTFIPPSVIAEQAKKHAALNKVLAHMPGDMEDQTYVEELNKEAEKLLPYKKVCGVFVCLYAMDI